MSEENGVRSPLRSWTNRFFVFLGALSWGLVQLQALEPEQAWINTAISVVGILLRFKTTQPIVNIRPPTS